MRVIVKLQSIYRGNVARAHVLEMMDPDNVEPTFFWTAKDKEANEARLRRLEAKRQAKEADRRLLREAIRVARAKRLREEEEERQREAEEKAAAERWEAAERERVKRQAEEKQKAEEAYKRLAALEAAEKLKTDKAKKEREERLKMAKAEAQGPYQKNEFKDGDVANQHEVLASVNAMLAVRHDAYALVALCLHAVAIA